MKEHAIITVKLHRRKKEVDLEIPLNITANDLIAALNTVYDLNIDTDNIGMCFLKMENPIALLHGNKTLREYKMRNGSVINITD